MAISIAKIPDSVFKEYSNKNTEMLEEAILNGILLPDDATNGDVIKAVFPNVENIRVDNGLPLNFILEFELHRNYKDWWNSPYKAGDIDGSEKV